LVLRVWVLDNTVNTFRDLYFTFFERDNAWNSSCLNKVEI
jgi:hypothetical protein